MLYMKFLLKKWLIEFLSQSLSINFFSVYSHIILLEKKTTTKKLPKAKVSILLSKQNDKCFKMESSI
jgi:hypothetical protein